MRLFLLLFCLLLPSSSFALTDASEGGASSVASTFSFHHLLCLLLVGGVTAAYPCHELPSTPTIADIVNCSPGNSLQIQEQGKVIDLSHATQAQIDQIFHKTTFKYFENSFRLVSSKINSLHVKIPVGGKKYSVEIQDNDNLVDLKIANTNTAGGKLKLTVRGNKRLSNESIESLKAIGDSEVDYMQDVGECLVPNPLPSTESLDGCAYVKGPFVIDENTNVTQSIPSSVTEIRGCLKITGTTWDNLDFLDPMTSKECASPGKHEISGNKDLCVHPEFQHKLEQKFSGIVLSGNKDCEGECSAAYLLEKMDSKCKIVTETLTISGKKSGENMQFMEGVREIRGRLVVIKNELEDMSFLKNLKTVSAKGYNDGPAIEISFNEKLKKVSLSSLSTVESDGMLIQMEGNGQFLLAKKEREELEKKFGKNKVNFVIPLTIPTGRNGTGGGNQAEVDTDEEEKRRRSGGLVGGGAIAGIIIGAMLLIVILAVVIAVLVLWRLRKFSKPYESIPITVHPERRCVYLPDKTPIFGSAKKDIEENKNRIQRERERRVEIMKENRCFDQIKAIEQEKEEEVKLDKVAREQEIQGKPVAANKEEKTSERRWGIMEVDKDIIDLLKIHEEKFADEHEVPNYADNNLLDNDDDENPMTDATQSGKEPPLMKDSKDADAQRNPGGKDSEQKPVSVIDSKVQSKVQSRVQSSVQSKIRSKMSGAEKVRLRRTKTKPKKSGEIAIIYHSNRTATYPFRCHREKRRELFVDVNHGKKADCGCLDGYRKENSEMSYCGVAWETIMDKMADGEDVSDYLELRQPNKSFTHEFYFNTVDSPVVYEQRFIYTAERMMEIPLEMNIERRAYQQEKKKELKVGIVPITSFKTAKRTGKMIPRIYPETYLVEHYEYDETCNKLPDMEKVRRPIAHFTKERFLKHMIWALMSCENKKWLNLDSEIILKLCAMAKTALAPYQPIKKIETPANVRIVGEVRGKFHELRKILSLPNDFCTSTNIHAMAHFQHVFLGNFVGGGAFNVETVALLFAMKALFKDKCVLLRGAFEWLQMNEHSTLAEELKARYPNNKTLLLEINDVFNHLPYACKIGKDIYCTHSGVAPDMDELDEVKLPIDKFDLKKLSTNLMFAHPNYTVKRYFDNVDCRTGYYFGEYAYYDMARTLEIKAMFISKALSTGWGVFGHEYPLYSLASAPNLEGQIKGFWSAIAEIEDDGMLTFKVLYQQKEEMPVIDKNAKLSIDKTRPRVVDREDTETAEDLMKKYGLGGKRSKEGESVSKEAENIGSKMSKEPSSQMSKEPGSKMSKEPGSQMSKEPNPSKESSQMGRAGGSKMSDVRKTASATGSTQKKN